MPRSYRSSDKRLNPELADQIADLRGGMEEVAEQSRMPERFEAYPHPDRPAMVITDTTTGRTTTVGLFAYRAAREALNDLFGTP